jgi:hypothetical protein
VNTWFSGQVAVKLDHGPAAAKRYHHTVQWFSKHVVVVAFATDGINGVGKALAIRVKRCFCARPGYRARRADASSH